MSNVYRDAIEVLAKKGWRKGSLGTVDGPIRGHCLVGAIGVAAQGNPAALAFCRSFEMALPNSIVREQFADRLKDVGEYIDEGYPTEAMAFNDNPDTTIEDVVLVLEKAAVALEEQI